MENSIITIRKSPFVFIKRLVVIEFFFALLPFLAAVIFDLQSWYESLVLSGSVSYTLFFSLAVTTIQVLIIGLVFLGWYLPTYQIGREHIIFQNANLLADKILVNTPSIYNISLKIGPLGRRMEYGALVISSSDGGEKVQLRDIPRPAQIREQILEFSGSKPTIEGKIHDKTVQQLIYEGESQAVEFKSSFLWDYRNSKVNKHLSEPVMKTVSAFLNTSGGILLIGVSDEGGVLGLDVDFKAMKKPNTDGFELIFNNAFNQAMGVEFRRFVEVEFPELEGKLVCLVRVHPATKPAYLNIKGREEFYIRAGNASEPLTVSKATNYIQNRFSPAGY
ncbi:MAG: putative DNA binding domain-containing protein [Anaerolineales bacterium]|jgi:membrane protein YdbS with pleckstrin-like domain